MFKTLENDRAWLENKYHKVDEPFDPYSRMAYHGHDHDPATGRSDEEILEGLRTVAKECEGLSHPMAKAKAIEYVLRNTRIDTNEHDYFIGLYSWNRLLRETTVLKWKTEVFDEILPEVGATMKDFNDSGAMAIWPDFDHVVPDWDSLMRLGFSGIRKRAGEYRAARENKCGLTARERDFFDAIDLEYSAIIAFLDRLYKHASAQKHEKAKTVADCLMQLRDGAPTNIYEAMQLIFLYFMISESVDHFQVRSLGNGLDFTLYPFYKNDLEKGIINEQDAFELIENLFINIFARLGKRKEKSGDNHGVVAGYTKSGECGHNACTSLILKAVTDLPIWRPQISYRYTKRTTREQFLEAIKANLKRPDLVMFLNDDVVIENLDRLGVPFEDAIAYSVSGCNETVLTGCSQMGSIEGHINLMYSFERLMCDGDRLEKTTCFEELYTALEEKLKEDIATVIRYSHVRDEHISHDPSWMESLFTSGCIESATPISMGGAKYNACTWCLTGIVNLADSLSAIRQVVFEDKLLTLGELAQAIASNWDGYEHVRSYILSKCNFFGNDDNGADLLVNRISETVCKISSEHTPYRGGEYIFGTLTGYEISHVVFGKSSMASPDGRRRGEAFAASVCSTAETAKKGVTAYLKSASKIDGRYLASSVVVNLTLDLSGLEEEKREELLLSLLTSYFSMGGVHLQINYLSAETLVDAKLHPEKYRSLRVRVTGFSGFFVTFEEKLQNEIINRSLYRV